MPKQTTMSIGAGKWTELTDTDVTNITFQNLGSGDLWIRGTADSTPPTDLDGANRYVAGQGELNIALADLFPGVSGCDRVFAWSETPSRVVVSHA